MNSAAPIATRDAAEPTYPTLQGAVFAPSVDENRSLSGRGG
jgi:hypothetical protein